MDKQTGQYGEKNTKNTGLPLEASSVIIFSELYCLSRKLDAFGNSEPVSVVTVVVVAVFMLVSAIVCACSVVLRVVVACGSAWIKL